MFGTAMSTKKVVFVFLFMKVMSGRLEGIVLSVIMLRFQYGLKLSLLLLLLLLLRLLMLLLTAIELSLGGSSPYTSTDKTNKNKYT
jgi:hypothetical protein